MIIITLAETNDGQILCSYSFNRKMMVFVVMVSWLEAIAWVEAMTSNPLKPS